MSNKLRQLWSKLQLKYQDERIFAKAYTNNYFWRSALTGRMAIFREVANKTAQAMASGYVLDIGTGFGYLPLEIKKICPRVNVVCLDIEERLFNHTRSKITNSIDFIKANVEALPFENNTFRALTCLFSIHQWHDKQEGINEIFRVLETEGKITLLVGQSYLTHGSERITDIFTKKSVKELERYFVNAGFQTINTKIGKLSRFITVTAIK